MAPTDRASPKIRSERDSILGFGRALASAPCGTELLLSDIVF
jgi:hypothetical protein